MKEIKVLKLIILAIISYSLSLWAKTPSSFSQLKFEFEKISQKQFIETLAEFVRASAPSRMIGKPGHEGAFNFITESIKSYDAKNSGSLIIDNFRPDISEALRFYEDDFKEKIEGKVPPSHPEYKKWFNFTNHMKQKAKSFDSLMGKNIIWEKSGLNASKTLVISAHYDTISHDPKTFLITDGIYARGKL
jgi:hypothetical protein